MSTTTSPAAGSEPNTPQKAVVRAKQLPDTAVALAALVTKAADAWIASDLPALLWLPKATLKTQAAAFTTAAKEADAAGSARHPQAARLKALDKQFDKSISFVKGYLHEAYDDDESYYSEFGIEKRGKRYLLPKDRDERVKSLAKLQAALVAHGFGERKYGTAYWTTPVADYTQLVKDSTDTAGDQSEKVDVKVAGEQKIRKALRALIHHIKANYPDSYQAKLRAFGFQKEKY